MDIFHFRKTATPRGVPVYYKRLPWASRWTEIRLVMTPGAICDPPEKEGVTHLLEHLFEKENRVLPCGKTVKQVDDDLLLSSLNARTGLDYVSVVCRCRVEHLLAALRVVGELVAPHTVNAEDLEAEKRIVIQEWRGDGEDKKDNCVLNSIFHKDLYRDHWMTRLNTYGGTQRTMRNITLADVHERERSLYNHAHFTLVLAGGIPADFATALAAFDARLATRVATPLLPPMNNLPLPSRARRDISRTKLLGKAYTETQTQIRVARVLHTPENLRLLRVADEMLEKLIYASARGHLSACYKFQVDHTLEADHCYFGVEGHVDPKETKRVLAAIEGCFAMLRTSDARELFEKTKQQLIARTPLMDCNAAEIADMATEQVVYAGRVISIAEKVRHTARVTFEDCLRFFQEELAEDKLYWFIVRP